MRLRSLAAARPHRLQQHMLRELVAPVRRLDRQRLDHDAVGDVGRRLSSDEVAQHARRLLGDAAGGVLTWLFGRTVAFHRVTGRGERARGLTCHRAGSAAAAAVQVEVQLSAGCCAACRAAPAVGPTDQAASCAAVALRTRRCVWSGWGGGGGGILASRPRWPEGSDERMGARTVVSTSRFNFSFPGAKRGLLGLERSFPLPISNSRFRGQKRACQRAHCGRS
jgi:hypothetical protein